MRGPTHVVGHHEVARAAKQSSPSVLDAMIETTNIEFSSVPERTSAQAALGKMPVLIEHVCANCLYLYRRRNFRVVPHVPRHVVPIVRAVIAEESTYLWRTLFEQLYRWPLQRTEFEVLCKKPENRELFSPPPGAAARQ